jgi:hypothetical protein
MGLADFYFGDYPLNLEFNLFCRILFVCVSNHALSLIFVVTGENSDEGPIDSRCR